MITDAKHGSARRLIVESGGLVYTFWHAKVTYLNQKKDLRHDAIDLDEEHEKKTEKRLTRHNVVWNPPLAVSPLRCAESAMHSTSSCLGQRFGVLQPMGGGVGWPFTVR
jgi:hypothetical protein